MTSEIFEGGKHFLQGKNYSSFLRTEQVYRLFILNTTRIAKQVDLTRATGRVRCVCLCRV